MIHDLKAGLKDSPLCTVGGRCGPGAQGHTGYQGQILYNWDITKIYVCRPKLPCCSHLGPGNGNAELNGGEMVPYRPQNGACGRALSRITQNHIMYTYLAQSQYLRGSVTPESSLLAQSVPPQRPPLVQRTFLEKERARRTP